MLIGHTQHHAQTGGRPLVASQAVRYHDLDARASRPAVQAADGSCDWRELRAFVDWHVSHGMVGVQVLGGTPAWDTDSAEEDGYGRPGGAAVPRTWAGYRAFVRSFCDTFSAAEAPYLSPWNEPFGPRSFDGSPADLVAMQRIVREEAPDRTILTPSFYSPGHARAFLLACPRELWDVLDLHLYGQTAEQLSTTLDAYAALAPGCRFALTETGWQPDSQTQPADSVRKDWKWPDMTRQQRADEWLRICRMCEARGDVDQLLWYSLDGYAKDGTAIYTMGDKPELLAAQSAAVERKDAAMATAPSLFELLSTDISAAELAMEQTDPKVASVEALLGQVRAYVDALLAVNASGGVMHPDEVQALRDRLSNLTEAIKAMGNRAAATAAANQLPTTTTATAPAPAAAPGVAAKA